MLMRRTQCIAAVSSHITMSNLVKRDFTKFIGSALEEYFVNFFGQFEILLTFFTNFSNLALAAKLEKNSLPFWLVWPFC